MQKDQKQMHIMPNLEKKNLTRIFHKHDTMHVNIKIIIIIAIFSLILISISTIILLSSYNPHATTLNTHQVDQQPLAQTATTNAQGVTLPSSPTKNNLLAVQTQITNFTSTMSADEQNFDTLVK